MRLYRPFKRQRPHGPSDLCAIEMVQYGYKNVASLSMIIILIILGLTTTRAEAILKADLQEPYNLAMSSNMNTDNLISTSILATSEQNQPMANATAVAAALEVDTHPAVNYTDDDIDANVAAKLTIDTTDSGRFPVKDINSELGPDSDQSNSLVQEEEVDGPIYSQDPNGSVKRRRHIDQHQYKVTDWWTRINHSTKRPSNQRRVHKGPKVMPKTFSDQTPTSVYKEQPLSQNIILTLRNQLAAIRNKHRLLMNRSFVQLYQLDNKLIDAYRLCIKHRHPLYAGMLYRTRDYVTRLANDVKFERRVLEAMARQVQRVLVEKVANKTLMRAFNKLMATSTEAPAPQRIVAKEEVKWTQDLLAVETTIVSKGTIAQINDTQPNSTEVSHEPLTSTTASATKTARDTKSALEKSSSKNQTRTGTAAAARRRQLARTGLDKSKSVQIQQAIREFEQDYTTTKAPPTKPKQLRYTVHINEVNLKKELDKTQALIDRVNRSSHELSSIVDDIVKYLKLDTSPLGRRGMAPSGRTHKHERAHTQVNSYDQMNHIKRKKKMFKSPIKVFLEKYGRMTLGPMNDLLGDNTAKEPDFSGMSSEFPDLKPLFNSTSLTYTDIIDDDLGFDTVVENTNDQ